MFTLAFPPIDMQSQSIIRLGLYTVAIPTGIVLAVLTLSPQQPKQPTPVDERFGSLPAVAASVSSPYVYSFNSAGTLNEAGSMDQSTSPHWWVNSGAKLIIKNGIGQTVQGDLPALDRFRVLYAAMNPLDTDSGLHPQNTFRLVSRNAWDNVRLQAQFKIVKNNLTQSPNRNASNGLLFMPRYVDSQTLYYAGIRVDGTAVIKKKYKGIYYTMAQKKILKGTYDATTNPNLLPRDEWIGLRNDVVTNQNGSVTVRLFMQRNAGPWVKILEATDDGSKYAGTPAITGEQYVGIRTDFMDVQFSNYRAESIIP